MNIIIHHAHENYCPECFSSNLFRDFHHCETFCEDCGLVVMDEVYFVDNSDYLDEREEKFKEYLKVNDLESSSVNLTYGDLFDVISKENDEKKKLKKKLKKSK